MSPENGDQIQIQGAGQMLTQRVVTDVDPALAQKRSEFCDRPLKKDQSNRLRAGLVRKQSSPEDTGRAQTPLCGPAVDLSSPLQLVLAQAGIQHQSRPLIQQAFHQ